MKVIKDNFILKFEIYNLISMKISLLILVEFFSLNFRISLVLLIIMLLR